jgi:cellulose synthase/poly-beta-1,6-N-acetylglucosamine synthase-like glycosyltransferase
MNPPSAALPASKAAPAPHISVVIPVYNEEENLAELSERLLTTLAAYGCPY